MPEPKLYTLVGPGSTKAPELQPSARPWSPGVGTQIPWTGLLALVLGFGCGTAALAFAMVSDGKVMNYWEVGGYAVQPTVIVAVLATLANALLSYAFTSGIAIFWWTGAMSGRSLHHLHASQSQGASLLALFRKRPVLNKMVAASAVMVVLLVDQPLFQRGIRVETHQQERVETKTLPISSSPLQLGATGIIPDHSDIFAPRLFHPTFSEVVRQYQARQPIKLAGFSCSGRCEAEIVAAGWDVACTERSSSYRLINGYELMEFTASMDNDSKTTYSGPDYIQTMFNVSVVYGARVFTKSDTAVYLNHHINISTLYKATPGGNGTLGHHDCILSEALVRYPIEISDDTLTLRSVSQTENRTLEMVSRRGELTGMGNSPSTLGGIWLALNSQYQAHAQIYRPVGRWAITTNDTMSNTYMRSPPQLQDPAALESENITWADPMDDIISTAHELTLRAAIATTDKVPWTAWGEVTGTQSEVGSPNLSMVNRTLNQGVEVTMSFTEAVYETQPGWLAGAFAVIGLACASIIPTYWGWWHLGRPVSMSVLEIAKAFDAPLLRDVDPNGSVQEHLHAVGKTRVRYGFGTQSVVQEKDGNNDQEGQQSPHPNAAPQLDLNIIEISDCEAEDFRFQQNDTISIISEATTNEAPEDCGPLEGVAVETPLRVDPIASPVAADPNTSDSPLPQAFDKESESLVVEQTLMFREVDSFSSGRGD